MNISDNIAHILARIETACQHSGRNPREVKLLLATKTVSAENIKIALQTGQTLIGENKIQEIKEKYHSLQDTPCQTHYIGHLQSNKIKDLLTYNVACLQSLDRLSLAEKLDQQLRARQQKLDVFIQVNTSNEASKFGIAPENAAAFAQKVAQFDSLRIKGLMTIGLFSAEEDKVRPCFQLLKTVQKQIMALQLPQVEMHELSMGMSHDLEVAIAEGSTIVRVGTAIFGQRMYPDSYYWNESKP